MNVIQQSHITLMPLLNLNYDPLVIGQFRPQYQTGLQLPQMMNDEHFELLLTVL